MTGYFFAFRRARRAHRGYCLSFLFFATLTVPVVADRFSLLFSAAPRRVSGSSTGVSFPLWMERNRTGNTHFLQRRLFRKKIAVRG
jgi:hypothetical protein